MYLLTNPQVKTNHALFPIITFVPHEMPVKHLTSHKFMQTQLYFINTH